MSAPADPSCPRHYPASAMAGDLTGARRLRRGRHRRRSRLRHRSRHRSHRSCDRHQSRRSRQSQGNLHRSRQSLRGPRHLRGCHRTRQSRGQHRHRMGRAPRAHRFPGLAAFPVDLGDPACPAPPGPASTVHQERACLASPVHREPARPARRVRQGPACPACAPVRRAHRVRAFVLAPAGSHVPEPGGSRPASEAAVTRGSGPASPGNARARVTRGSAPATGANPASAQAAAYQAASLGGIPAANPGTPAYVEAMGGPAPAERRESARAAGR
jgi:hypothetical protein